MNQRVPSGPFGPTMSTAIGQLIVKLRRDGLFSSDDVQAILRATLIDSATEVSASMRRPASFLETMQQGYAAAE